MKLVKITKLDGSAISLYKQWQTKSFLSRTYDDPEDLLKTIRQVLPSGRFALAIKDEENKVSYFLDTQMIEKVGNEVLNYVPKTENGI